MANWNNPIIGGLGLVSGINGMDNYPGPGPGNDSYRAGYDAVQGVFGILSLMQQTAFGMAKQVIELNKQLVASQGQILSSKLEMINATVETALGAFSGGFEQTANRLVVNQAKKMLELAKTNVKAQYAMEYAQASMNVERMATINTMTEEILSMSSAMNQMLINGGAGIVSAVLNTPLGSGIINAATTVGAGVAGEEIARRLGASDGMASIAGVLSSTMSTLIQQNSNVSNGLANVGQAALGMSASMLSGLEALTTSLEINLLDLQVANARLHLEVMKQAQELAQQYIDSAQKMTEPWMDIVDKITQGTEKFDTEYRKMITSFGYVGDQGDKYIKGQLAMAEHMATTFGKTQEEMVAVTKAYQDAAGGRQVNMSQAAYDTQFATGRLFDMGDNDVAQLYGGMNIFNTSVESAGDHMTKMYKTVTKMGLSTSKFGKDLIENLKKAQKYNFRGGVENMMKLTQWAQQTRFNLESATSFSDKILGGTLSDAIETSAKLQVLGGAAAIYSDPLGMIYDAGADVGSLAKRQAGMFSDLMGTFNEKTGETDFSWYENYMIKQRAAAAGMSEEDAKNMIRQQNKQGTINKVLRGYNLDDETKTAIGNRATYNQKSGQWEVTDIRGETHNIEDYASGKLSLDDLLPENNDDAMLKIAEKSLGFEEQQTNYQKAITMHFAQAEYDQIVLESMKNLNAEKDMYNNPNAASWIHEMIPTTYSLGRASFENMNNLLNSGQMQDIVRNYLAGVERETAGRGRDYDDLSGAMKAFAKSAKDLEQYVEKKFHLDRIDAAIARAAENAHNVSEQVHNNMREGMSQVPGGSEIMDGLSRISAGSIDVAGDLIVTGVRGTRAATNVLDGIGYTNGGIITNVSDITPINDGTAAVKTAKDDQILAARRGGTIDRIVDGVFVAIQHIAEYIDGIQGSTNRTISSNSPKIDINVNTNGTISLVDSSNGHIISNILSSDNGEATRVASILARSISDAIVDNTDSGRFNWGQHA